MLTWTPIALLVTGMVTFAAPATPEPAREPTEVADPAPAADLARAYLRSQGVDADALQAALRLRLPSLPFAPLAAASAEATQPDTLAAFVQIERTPPGLDDTTAAFALTIVISDGRAFDRTLTVDLEQEDPARVLASTTANLLIAIEAGTVAPDRGDAPIPVAPVACPPCECPQPPTCPVVTPAAPTKPTPSKDPPPPPPRLTLGPTVAIGTTLGLGVPRGADRFAAAGLTTGLHLGLRRGAFFGGELRVAGRRSPVGGGTTRLRVALGAGYRHQRGPWSIGASAWATVEPWWWVGGELDPAPLPMLGLAARLTPALRLPQVGQRPVAISIGPILELAASANLGHHTSASAIAVQDADSPTEYFIRVGGFELNTGLGTTVWF